MCMYQRSCDMFLGIPFNIASYALLLELIAMVTGLEAKKLTMFLADVHIYQNHLAQVQEQLQRPTHKLPLLHLDCGIIKRSSDTIRQLELIQPDDIQLINYEHEDAIKAEMAV